MIIPEGRLPFPTVSLKLLAPPPTLPPPWKLFHLLTGPLLATWCPLPGPLGPRSWLVCLCILSLSLFPSLSQPSVILHDSDASSFASILSVFFSFYYFATRPRRSGLHSSELPFVANVPLFSPLFFLVGLSFLSAFYLNWEVLRRVFLFKLESPLIYVAIREF